MEKLNQQLAQWHAAKALLQCPKQEKHRCYIDSDLPVELSTGELLTIAEVHIKVLQETISQQPETDSGTLEIMYEEKLGKKIEIIQ